MIEPSTITAGDSAEWVRHCADYPANEWEGVYALFNADHAYSFTTTDDGVGGHKVVVPSATTGTWIAGRYDWTFYVFNREDRSTRKSIKGGKLTISPDPAQTIPMDSRSHSEKMLEAIEAVIEGKAGKGQLDLIRATHNGRDWESNPELLMKWRETYTAEVRNQRHREALARGEGNREMRLKVRF